MKQLIFILCSPLALSASHATESQAPDAAGRWTAKKAQQWYDSQPWPCGFNCVPARLFRDPVFDGAADP